MTPEMCGDSVRESLFCGAWLVVKKYMGMVQETGAVVESRMREGTETEGVGEHV